MRVKVNESGRAQSVRGCCHSDTFNAAQGTGPTSQRLQGSAAKLCGQQLRLGASAVMYEDVSKRHLLKSVAGSTGSSPCANDQGTGSLAVTENGRQRLHDANPVRVVAEECPRRCADDSVDGTDGTRRGRETGQQGDNGLLVRHGNAAATLEDEQWDHEAG